MALGSDEDLREMWEWAAGAALRLEAALPGVDLMVQGQWNVICPTCPPKRLTRWSKTFT